WSKAANFRAWARATSTCWVVVATVAFDPSLFTMTHIITQAVWVCSNGFTSAGMLVENRRQPEGRNKRSPGRESWVEKEKRPESRRDGTMGVLARCRPLRGLWHSLLTFPSTHMLGYVCFALRAVILAFRA